EAGTKYILLGALASAFLLLGISYLYGLTGTTRYEELSAELAMVEMSPGLIVALTLITAGLGFKVAAVPFHMWTPDVYEGAPIPVVAYLAAASKAAGFALLLRLVAVAFAPLLPYWDWALLLLAVLSMVLGNLVAIQQSNIKRLMAYSSIGQAGYMLLGVAALGAPQPAMPTTGLLFHIAGYAASTLAAFFVILEVYRQTGKEGVRDFAGLAERSPYLALVLTAALFSLAGFPFFVGFASKFYLFTAAATAGWRFLLAAGIAILASLVSLYYYLLIIRQMYMERPEGGTASRLRVPASAWGLLALLLAAMVVPGLYPRPLVEFAARAAAALFPSV
ncbi:MAG: NADH-quinone oxidoreductase subunit N, partial [Chloroflexi bacterium]|nr:NADH-quinone oxidoreductase subunit N [Chloroflexota bacterium]